MALLTAKVSFFPKQKYLGPELEEGQKVSYVWNGMSWHTYKTDCTASFIGVLDGDVGYAYRYQYVAAAAMVLTGLAVGAFLARHGHDGRKIRTTTTTTTTALPEEEDEYYHNDDNPFHWLDYRRRVLDGEASIAPGDDGTLRSLPLTRSQKLLLKALEGGDPQGMMIPGFVPMSDHPNEDEAAIEKPQRRLFLPRFLRRK